MSRERGPATGALYRVAPSLEVTKVLDGIAMANTLSFGPAGMTFADSEAGSVWRLKVASDTGAIESRSELIRIEPTTLGLADGAAADEEGAVWIAIARAGMVLRVAPSGEILHTIRLPVTKPTCCAFGGKDLRTLFVTTARSKLSAADLSSQPLAGPLLRIDVGIRGLPEGRFAVR